MFLIKYLNFHAGRETAVKFCSIVYGKLMFGAWWGGIEATLLSLLALIIGLFVIRYFKPAGEPL
jgi:hypothetical protein